MRSAKAAEVNETRPADPKGEVVIENVAGSVTIAGWDRNEVSVTGTICEACKLEVDGEGDRIKVRVKSPEHQHHSGKEDGSQITVHLPQGSQVSCSTVSAGQDVSGVKGDLELQAVSGGIKVRGNPGRIEAQTVAGDIDIEAVTRRLEASVVSGDVRIRGAEGEAEAAAVSGNIEIAGGTFRSVEASAVSGDVLFDGGLEKEARCELNSHSGKVEMRVPADLSADFSVETFSGEIRNDFGQSAIKSSEYGPGKELQFTLGSGSARIELNSFSGEVVIQKR
jgi:DUF4097 and DUF4098 domain-containing protein YvlB